MNKHEKTTVAALSAILVVVAVALIALSLLVISAPVHAQGMFGKKAEPAPAASAAPAPTPIPQAPPAPPAASVAPSAPTTPPAAPMPAAKPVKQTPVPAAKPAARPAPATGGGTANQSPMGVSNAVRPVRPSPPQSSPYPSAGQPSAQSPQPAVVVKSPTQACGNLNFLAMAVCVSAYCILPEYKGAGECVKLEQERLAREKNADVHRN